METEKEIQTDQNSSVPTESRFNYKKILIRVTRSTVAILILGTIIPLAMLGFVKVNSEFGSVAFAETPEFETETIVVQTFSEQVIEIPDGWELANPLDYEFVELSETSVTVAPGKTDIANFQIILKPTTNLSGQRKQVTVNTEADKYDAEQLKKEILALLGSKKDVYGVYLKDMQTDQKVDINAAEIFPSASIAKIPVAILTLRDIQAGKAKLTDTYPISNSLKHGSTEDLAQRNQGTQVSVDEYLTRLIHESSNTAWYHLRNRLGGVWGETGVNERTKSELNVSQYFEDPLIAQPEDVGKVFEDLYGHVTLDDEHAEYLLGLMKTSLPDTRLAIPSGVPEDVEVANKVGFLFGGREGSTYADAAIVYGPKSDYVLVVLNSRAPEYPTGAYLIKDISELVYKFTQT